MFSYPAVLIFIINIVARRVSSQTIANIADLDTELPNFYGWMEQNAYICEDSQPDAPIFLTEMDANQFNCIALCGDPLENPHLACSKRHSQRAHEWPQCHPVPPLCVLNFVQEFLALRIARGQFSIDHLTAAIHRPQPTTTPSPPFHSTDQFPTPNPRTDGGSFERNFPFESNRGETGFFTVVDRETNSNSGELHRQKQKSSRKSDEDVNRNAKKHLIEGKASMELKDSPALSAPLPPKLTFGHNNKLNCPPDVDAEACKFWANEGECRANPAYMHRECPRACGLCDKGEEFRS